MRNDKIIVTSETLTLDPAYETLNDRKKHYAGTIVLPWSKIKTIDYVFKSWRDSYTYLRVITKDNREYCIDTNGYTEGYFGFQSGIIANDLKKYHERFQRHN